MDTATGQPIAERLFPMPKQVVSPEIAEWSPSGGEIIVEDAVNPAEHILWVVSKDGSRLQKVVTYASETYSGLDWSPDGKTLYFSALEGDRMKIFSVPRVGGPAKKKSATAPATISTPASLPTVAGSPAPKWPRSSASTGVLCPDFSNTRELPPLLSAESILLLTQFHVLQNLPESRLFKDLNETEYGELQHGVEDA